jgi:hypothetical protein
LAVAVAARLLHQELDAAINAFGQGITEPILEDADDASQMGFEGARHLLDGLQLGSHREHVPFVKERVSNVTVLRPFPGSVPNLVEKIAVVSTL